MGGPPAKSMMRQCTAGIRAPSPPGPSHVPRRSVAAAHVHTLAGADKLHQRTDHSPTRWDLVSSLISSRTCWGCTPPCKCSGRLPSALERAVDMEPGRLGMFCRDWSPDSSFVTSLAAVFLSHLVTQSHKQASSDRDGPCRGALNGCLPCQLPTVQHSMFSMTLGAQCCAKRRQLAPNEVLEVHNPRMRSISP